MKHLVTLTVVLIFLTGCVGTASRTPDQVHRDWIAAIQDNDIEAAQELVEPSLVPQIIGRFSDVRYLAISDSGFYGELQSLDIEAPTTDGAAQKARSHWLYDEEALCLTATMREIDSVWYITNWSQNEC